MKCPRCPGALVEEDRAGLSVDRCDQCNGLWLDHGEAEIVSRPEDAELLRRLAAMDPHEAAPDTSGPLSCPRCGEAMLRERYADSAVEIDRCGEHGVWLDDGELEKITAYRLRVLERLNQEAEEPTDQDHDFTFSAASLERAFARIYFDQGS